LLQRAYSLPSDEQPLSINFWRAGLIERSARDCGINDQQHHLNQDKLIMEMADLVSVRRMEINILILALNTALPTVFASLAKEKILSRRPIPLACLQRTVPLAVSGALPSPP
jgi:hypothetical protein